MAKEKQIADPMLDVHGEPIYGTALYRVVETIDDQVEDQESATFYAGDIRDVCNTCNQKDKAVIALRESVKGKVPGESVSLVLKDVRDVVRLIKSPTKLEPVA